MRPTATPQRFRRPARPLRRISRASASDFGIALQQSKQDTLLYICKLIWFNLIDGFKIKFELRRGALSGKIGNNGSVWHVGERLLFIDYVSHMLMSTRVIYSNSSKMIRWLPGCLVDLKHFKLMTLRVFTEFPVSWLCRPTGHQRNTKLTQLGRGFGHTSTRMANWRPFQREKSSRDHSN